MKLIPSSLLVFNKHKETWLWRPSCKNPKTLSFRAGDTMFKTVNSVFYDPKYSQHVEPEAEISTTPDSTTNSSESASISTDSEDYFNTNGYNSSLETIVRGVRSERLLFEPGPTTSSILEGKKQCQHVEIIGGGGGGGGGDIDGGTGTPFKESVAMAIESSDPHKDFKKSMEEMVESHGLKDKWECLEELLGWYLRMNGKNHHEMIVGAFVDLLAGISGGGGGGGNGGTGGGASSSDHSTASFTSVASTFTSPISSPLLKGGGEIEIIEEDKILTNH